MLLPHQERVVVEKQELDEKLDKLKAFINSPNFSNIVLDVHEAARLIRQRDAMMLYSAILQERIDAFAIAHCCV